MDKLEARIPVAIGSERGFAAVFALVFLLLGFQPLLNKSSPRVWMLLTSVAIMTAGLLVPRLLVIPNRLWFRLGMTIGTVMSQVVMAVLFVLVVTPTGFLRKLVSGSTNRSRTFPDRERSTFWVDRGPDENPMGSLRNQY